MPRFDYRKVKPEKRRQFLDRLAKIVVNLKDEDQTRFFFQRLLTESELVMLMRRWEVAELLVGGRTYEQIERKLGAGRSTIAGVDRWLTDAAYEYQLIREEQKQAAREKADRKRVAKIVERRERSLVEGLPDALRGKIRGDSRMILFRLLLGDF